MISDVVVDTHLPAYTFGAFFDHQLRWARAVRDSRKLDYIGLGFTFGLPWALVAVLFARGATWSWFLFRRGCNAASRMAIAVGRFVLVDRQVTRNLWLIPIRDVVALIVWIVSFFGHTVRWSSTSLC